MTYNLLVFLPLPPPSSLGLFSCLDPHRITLSVAPRHPVGYCHRNNRRLRDAGLLRGLLELQNLLVRKRHLKPTLRQFLVSFHALHRPKYTYILVHQKCITICVKLVQKVVRHTSRIGGIGCRSKPIPQNSPLKRSACNPSTRYPAHRSERPRSPQNGNEGGRGGFPHPNPQTAPEAATAREGAGKGRQ